MFWESIIAGLAILGHWQVLVSIILYITIIFAFRMIVGTIAGKDEFSGRMVLGYLFNIIGLTVLPGILISFIVAFLFPILLGIPSTAHISEIISFLWPIIIAGLISVLVVFGLCFIPLIGSFIANSPGIQIFLEGITIFIILCEYDLYHILSKSNVYVISYPGFLESIVFLIVALIPLKLMMYVSSFLYVFLKNTLIRNIIFIVIIPVLEVLVGIIPLFMYISYVRLSIMQLIGG